MHSNLREPHMARRLVLTSWAVAALLSIAGAPARAQTASEAANQERARALAAAGLEAFHAGDFVSAHDKLNQGYALLAVPTVGLWSARAAVKLGKLVEASKRYREVTRGGALVGDLNIQKKAQSDAASELAALTSRIPTLTIQIDGAPAREVTVSLNGVRLAPESIAEVRQLNPGSHIVEATRGDESYRSEVRLVEGKPSSAQFHFKPPVPPPPPVVAEAAPAPALLPAPPPAAAPEQQVQLSVPPAPPPEASPLSAPAPASAPAPRERSSPGSALRTTGVIAMILGGASLIGSGVTTGLAFAEKSSIRNCVDDRCPTQYSGRIDTHNSYRTTSMITFYAGAGLGVVGLTLLLVAPSGSKADNTAVALQLGPGSARVSGVF